MTSKEAFIKIREIMNEYHHCFVKESIKVKAIDGYPLDQIEKDLELLEKYKRVMCEPIKDIMKELEMLDILKENIKLIDYCIFNDKIVIYLPVQYREKLKEWLENANNL